MDPLTKSLILSAIGVGGSALGGIFGRERGKETPTQQRQKMAIDDILAGIKGEGPYASLFSADQDAFQRSYVDPAKSRFEKQIAPQIQQEFIASGQQRGTGLDDTLSRAGVDMDMQLAEQYGQFQENALQRQLQALGITLGAGSGAPVGQSAGSAAGQGLAGYFASPGFSTGLSGLLDQYSNRGYGGSGSNALASGGSIVPVSRGAGSATRRGYIQ